jgi:hypothetical protein
MKTYMYKYEYFLKVLKIGYLEIHSRYLNVTGLISYVGLNLEDAKFFFLILSNQTCGKPLSH